MDRAARIALREIRRHLAGPTAIEKVVLVCFGAEALATYRRALEISEESNEE